ncbi:MAG: hypothetical protein JJ974_11030 [Phycisphaerales bacterium]|nr:hypothetical protein [Phycisphaerales bacterium]
MEPGLMIAVMVSCMVAVGAGVFVAIQGSKSAGKKGDNQSQGDGGESA